MAVLTLIRSVMNRNVQSQVPHSETFIHPFIKLLAKSKCLTKNSYLVNHCISWLQYKKLKQNAFCGVIIEFPDKNRPHLLLATATVATARKESIYDVIFLEYLATGLLQVLQLARSLAMTSLFWSTLLPCYWFATGATGATARKEFNYDVIFLEYLATGLLQVLQLARSLAMTLFFWSTLLLVCYRCYRCYSSQGVHL